MKLLASPLCNKTSNTASMADTQLTVPSKRFGKTTVAICFKYTTLIKMLMKKSQHNAKTNLTCTLCLTNLKWTYYKGIKILETKEIIKKNPVSFVSCLCLLVSQTSSTASTLYCLLRSSIKRPHASFTSTHRCFHLLFITYSLSGQSALVQPFETQFLTLWHTDQTTRRLRLVFNSYSQILLLGDADLEPADHLNRMTLH